MSHYCFYLCFVVVSNDDDDDDDDAVLLLFVAPHTRCNRRIN